MSHVSHYLRPDHADLPLTEVLQQPIDVLIGVNSTSVDALAQLGIGSVFDLGSSWLFANATAAAETRRTDARSGHLGPDPSDWLKPTASFQSLEEIGNLPLINLRGLTDSEAAAIETALGVTAIRDFALWPPRQMARQLVCQAMGSTIDTEEQQAEALRPRLGEFPTERVYYSKLVMLQMNETDQHTPLEAPISLLPAVDRPFGFGKPAVGAFLTYSQSWHAKGVTLGHMLHSLALAPGEATRMAVIDWSRRQSATATEAITETERLDNSTTHARAISEVQNAVAKEMQQGGSMSSGWSRSSSEATAGASSSVSIPVIGFGFGSDSGSTTTQTASTDTFAESASWSVGNRSVLSSMTQHVNDRTEQHASSVRNRRAAAVREVSQSEHEEVSTRIVANYNHMHALTVQYYEVVQIYEVMAQLHGAERCLFVPFELIDFSAQNGKDFVERFRGSLIKGALTSRARDLLIDDTTMVAITPTVKTSSPVSRSDLMLAPLVFAARVDQTSTITEVEDPQLLSTHRAHNQPAPASKAAASPGTTSASFQPSLGISKFGGQHFWNITEIEQVSRLVGRVVMRPKSDALHLPDDTELLALSFDGVNVASVRLDRPGIAATDSTFTVPTDNAHVDLPERIRLHELDAIHVARAANDTLHAGSMTLHCSYRGRHLKTPTIPLQLAMGTAMQKVVALHTDEIDRQKELLAHLQANRAHYSQIVFGTLDSATLVMLLSQFIWNGRPLADQVEPSVLSVADNYLVLKAPVDEDEPSGIMESESNLTWGTLLEKRDILLKPPDTRLVPVPTNGVFAEAVLGRSNSAEKLDITRFWNWEDAPIPLQPPEISPIATGSRATAEDLTPGQLGAPVLNIVNPTSLPDPAGLGASLGVLASGNLFRDMSGLQGTQAIAQAAASETLAAASQAGQLASTNLQAEAQKLVAMGQIAADVAKTAMGVPPSGSTKGISADGARINHGKDMDKRGIPGPGQTSPGGGASVGGGGGGGSAGGGVSNGASSRSAFSREGAFADRSAFGFSPDAVKATTDALSGLSGGSQGSQNRPQAGAQQAKRLRWNRTKQIIPTGDGHTIIENDAGEDFVAGSILLSNFDVNGTDLKAQHLDALTEIAALFNLSEETMIAIEGRASQTGPEENNEYLSDQRANEPFFWLTAVGNVSEDRFIDIIGLGSLDPIVDNRGIEEALNRSAKIRYQLPLPAILPDPPKKPTPTPQGTTRWSFRVDLSGGYFKAKIGGTGFLGQIRNRDTGESRTGFYAGLGLGAGVGLGLPQGSFGDWEDFETDELYVLDDFDLTLVRFTSLGASVFIGYTFAYVSFPLMDANSISVGGFEGGSVGVDGGTTVGTWKFID